MFAFFVMSNKFDLIWFDLKHQTYEEMFYEYVVLEALGICDVAQNCKSESSERKRAKASAIPNAAIRKRGSLDSWQPVYTGLLYRLLLGLGLVGY